jgi:hypothetical protein
MMAAVVCVPFRLAAEGDQASRVVQALGCPHWLASQSIRRPMGNGLEVSVNVKIKAFNDGM